MPFDQKKLSPEEQQEALSQWSCLLLQAFLHQQVCECNGFQSLLEEFAEFLFSEPFQIQAQKSLKGFRMAFHLPPIAAETAETLELIPISSIELVLLWDGEGVQVQ